MNRSLFSTMLLLVIGITIFTSSGGYFAYYWCRWSNSCTEQEAIAYLQHEIISFKSLDFSPSSEVVSMLECYTDELAAIHKKRNAAWVVPALNFQDDKLDELIVISKRILQSYVRDLQEYTNMGIATTSTIVQFSYDTVVRLTIALAELEKSRIDRLPQDEYLKKVNRMHEIMKQSIVHSKKMLRSCLQAGLKEEHVKVQIERNYLTNKVRHFIDLDKILYL